MVIKKSRGRVDALDVLVGHRVRERRLILGMSQEKLAGALGITFQQVQKYERGANRISAGRLYNIAVVMKVAIDTFFSPATTKIRASLEDREVLEIVRAFKAIHNPAIRRSALNMVRSLGRKGKNNE